MYKFEANIVFLMMGNIVIKNVHKSTSFRYGGNVIEFFAI